MLTAKGLPTKALPKTDPKENPSAADVMANLSDRLRGFVSGREAKSDDKKK